MRAPAVEGVLGQLEPCMGSHVRLTYQDGPCRVLMDLAGYEKPVALSGGKALRSKYALTQLTCTHPRVAARDGRGVTRSQVHLLAS